MASCNKDIRISLHKIKEGEKFWLDDPKQLFINNQYTKFFPRYEMTRVEQFNSLSRFFLYMIILIFAFGQNEQWLVIPIVGLVIVVILYNFHKADKFGKDKELDRILQQRKERRVRERQEDAVQYRHDDEDPQKLLDIQNDEDYGETVDAPIDEENKSLYPEEGKYQIQAGMYDLEGKLLVGAKPLPPKYKREPDEQEFTVDEILEYQKNTCRRPTPDNPMMNPDLTEYGNGDPPAACNADDEDIKNEINVNFNHQLFRDVDEIWERENSQRQFYTLPNTAVPNNQIEFAKWLYLPTTNCKTNQENCLRYEDLRYKRDNYKR